MVTSSPMPPNPSFGDKLTMAQGRDWATGIVSHPLESESLARFPALTDSDACGGFIQVMYLNQIIQIIVK